MHDDKFNDHVINIFEICNPNNNVFLIGTLQSEKLKYTKAQHPSIKVANYDSSIYIDALESKPFDAVFVHYLDRQKAKVLEGIDKKVKKVWLVWGADFYDHEVYKGNLYQPTTKKIVKRNERVTKGNIIKRTIRQLYYSLLKRNAGQVFPTQDYLSTVEGFSYYATVIPTESALLKQLPNFSAKQVFFKYAAIETIVNKEMYVSRGPLNVLVGNSNSSTSNHADAFEIIERLDNINEVIVPLSYGGDMLYKQEVIKYGNQLFGKKFKALNDFMTIDQYNEVLKTCQIAIFNHERQQAVGNIIAMVYMGTKVFLSENSPVYSYLKAIGVKVFSIQTELNNDNIHALSDLDVRVNRELLYKEYSIENVIRETKDTLSTINASI